MLEYASEGRTVQDDRPYANRYVSVLTISDRLVTRWRDYLTRSRSLTHSGGPRPTPSRSARLPTGAGKSSRASRVVRFVTFDLEARVRRLEDRVLISDRVITYAVAVDQRDWALFADCFTDPVHADYSENGLAAADFARDDLVDIVRSAVSGYTATQHLSANHVTDFDRDDPDRATCHLSVRRPHSCASRKARTPAPWRRRPVPSPGSARAPTSPRCRRVGQVRACDGTVQGDVVPERSRRLMGHRHAADMQEQTGVERVTEPTNGISGSRASGPCTNI